MSMSLFAKSLFLAMLVSDVLTLKTEKPELHILGLFPMTGPWPGGPAVLVAAEMAVEDINNRTDILPDHTLRLHWQDSQCLAGGAINALFQQLYAPPVKHIIFGPACSITCQPTAEASHVWNISQIAYGCGSPSLSNKKVYKRYFRTVASDTSIVPLHVEMMRVFNWRKIATLHQSYDTFIAGTNQMLNEISDDNVTVLLSAAFMTEPDLQVDNLHKHDARIIFGGFYAASAPKVFCEAYKRGLYGPKMAWFTSKWYPLYWWKNIGVTDCTEQQLLDAVDGVFYTGMPVVNPRDDMGLAGLNNTQLARLFSERTGGAGFLGSAAVASYYDGMYTVALALNNTVNKLREIGHPKALENFNYTDGDIGDVMTQSTFEVDFQGVLGHLSFDENGDPARIIAIDQQQGEERVNVGYYIPSTDPNTRGVIAWVNEGIKWRGGRPPRDSSIIRHRRLYVSGELYGTLSSLAGLGIALTLFFFVFNICFRERRLIKMSSPNINNVILMGCLLGYSTVFLQERPGSDVTEGVLCVMRQFIFMTGFSLSFGALFSKTWRIHRILTMSSKMKKVVIKDSKLIAIVLGLVMVDMLILVTWLVSDPLTLDIKDLKREVSETELDVEIVPQLPTCTCKHEMYFTGALYVIQGAMLAFGAFLAWETRNVKVEALNDSKQIGVCIYNVLTLSVLGAAVSLVVEDNINVSYGFTSAIVLVGTTLIQGIIFVPKVNGLRRGDQIVVHSSTTASSNTNSAGRQQLSVHSTGGSSKI